MQPPPFPNTPPPEAIANAALLLTPPTGTTTKHNPDLGQDATLPMEPFTYDSDTPTHQLTLPDAPAEVVSDTINKPFIAQQEVHSAPIVSQDNQPQRLPSLLRYVDNILLQNAALHNQPQHQHATCNICFRQWNAPVYNNGQESATTYLPLTCGHTVHYSCLIWLATFMDDRKDKCPSCNVQLYHWDGISALTLATRTGLKMQDKGDAQSMQMLLGQRVETDQAGYEADCTTIDSIINAEFFKYLRAHSKNADGSPHLVKAFHDALATLKRMSKPKARWLQYTTDTGFLLWSALVAIKMRRYLIDQHPFIQITQGWTDFEKGRQTIQEKLMQEVHQP